MGRRRVLKEPKEHITRDVLLNLLKAGVVLAVAVTEPGALRAFKPVMSREKRWRRYYPSSIERHTMKLWRKGFVELQETAEGHVVAITDKGKTETLRYDIENMEIKEPGQWDGKWRIVFFDIPASHEARNHFREKLLSLGFFQMQKSVYVHPYPCDKEITFLREIYHMPHSVKYAEVTRLENDEDLRSFFRLR